MPRSDPSLTSGGREQGDLPPEQSAARPGCGAAPHGLKDCGAGVQPLPGFQGAVPLGISEAKKEFSRLGEASLPYPESWYRRYKKEKCLKPA